MRRYTKVLSFMLFLVAMIAVSQSALAQCSTTGNSFENNDKNPVETRIFTIVNVRAEDLCKTLVLFHADMQSNNSLRTLSIKTDLKTMDVISDTIKRLDVAPPPPPPVTPRPWYSRDMQLTVYVLGADNTQTARPPIPAVLQPVVDGLKSLLTYRSMYVVDTLYQAGKTDGNINLSGTMPNSAYMYEFAVYATMDSSDPTHSTIKLPTLKFTVNGVRGADGKVPALASISSPIDVQQGKQTVIGKATVGDSAYILVISVKIL